MRKRYTAKQKAQIVLEILREERPITQVASEYGIHPNQLNNWKAQALEGLPKVFEEDYKGEKTLKAIHEHQLQELNTEIGRLNTQLTWLKKYLASRLSRNERVKMIEPNNADLSLQTQAQLLDLSRASLYYHPVGPSPREITCKHRIDELYTKYPFYGSRRMTAVLRREGLAISRPIVQKYMREMGIAGIAPGPKLSKPQTEHKVYPYLLRGLCIERPNQVWSIDITYIRLAGGWMYLVAILDWFSCYVVAWELDQNLGISFVLRAMDQALAKNQPEIWNSDQGSHFTSPQYTQRLLAADIRISMDARGRAMDNIFNERLWRSVKYEEVCLNDYQSPREARHGIDRYMNFYNLECPHQSLTYFTPAQVYCPYKHSPRSDFELIAFGLLPGLNAECRGR